MKMTVSQPPPTDRNHRLTESMVAKPLAPEDVRRGDYVALLQVTYELPSFLWCAESFRIPHDHPVRLTFMTPEGAQPAKVREICLPFVLVKTPDGQQQMLDLRRHRLARIGRRFGKAAWKGKAKVEELKE